MAMLLEFLERHRARHLDRVTLKKYFQTNKAHLLSLHPYKVFLKFFQNE